MDKAVTNSNLPEPFDINANFKWISGIIGFLVAYVIYLIQYFKYKAKDKEEFIVKVVEATVKATLASELQGIKEDVKKLFDYRESDRTHYDKQFNDVIKEIRK